MILDNENPEFNYAVDCIENTSSNLFLTGKAGTGKTTFLKHIKESSKRNVIVLAPTGVAAVHAGGQTIHSFFNIQPSPYLPDEKRFRLKAPKEDPDQKTFFDYFDSSYETVKIIRSMDLLIIDEVSMVRCDLLDTIDTILRIRRRRMGVPWGGVQVLLIGDPFQLPPVNPSEEWDLLENYYPTPFFFSANVFRNKEPIYIELKKIYRQTEIDFINLLNRVRVNCVNSDDLKYLNLRYSLETEYIPEQNQIVLTTHNNKASGINQNRLDEIEEEEFIYNAEISGHFDQNKMIAVIELKLKIGAQVMFLKNDQGKKYYNGKIGTVRGLSQTKIFVAIAEDEVIELVKAKWQNIKYEWNETSGSIQEKIIGECTQYPIKLAWAVTVHKSQGLTFENVYADLDGSFTSGQVYVALSRCTSLNGLKLKSKISRSAIKTDLEVIEFSKRITPDTLLVETLNQGRADLLYKRAWEQLNTADFGLCFDSFIRATQYRNDLKSAWLKRIVLIFLNRNFRNVLRINKMYGKLKELNKIKSDFEIQNEYINLLDQKIERQANEIVKANATCGTLNLENQSLKTSVVKLNQTNQAIKEASEKLTLSNLSLKNEFANKKKELSVLESKCRQYEAEISKMKIKIELQETEKIEKDSRIRKLFSRTLFQRIRNKNVA
jgi:hypothetical protein